MKLQETLKKNLRFGFVILGLFAFRWSLADQYQVPSGSMEPNIHVGDRIVVNKTAYDLKFPFTHHVIAKMSEPSRGDIIVFDNPQNGICMVKRLIALPGDEVEIQDGFITINGKAFDGSTVGMSELEAAKSAEVFYQEQVGEHSVLIKRIPSFSRSQHLKFQVPADSFFAMGDNRDNSLDSRSWGFVHRENLKGKAFRIFYNLSFNDSFVPNMEFSRIGKRLN